MVLMLREAMNPPPEIRGGWHQCRHTLSVAAESQPLIPWVGLLARKDEIGRFTFPGGSEAADAAPTRLLIF